MRSVEEWIGSSDDQAIPARVKIRVFDAFDRRCAVCTLQIAGKLRPAYDHATALINGGQNRETNLQLLCMPCHALKTKTDVAEKSITARKRAKHIGVFAPRQKMQSAPFRKSAPQHTATRPISRSPQLRGDGECVSDHGVLSQK